MSQYVPENVPAPKVKPMFRFLFGCDDHEYTQFSVNRNFFENGQVCMTDIFIQTKRMKFPVMNSWPCVNVA